LIGVVEGERMMRSAIWWMASQQLGDVAATAVLSQTRIGSIASKLITSPVTRTKKT
jgi:hypothetical protein